jgi:WhiB family redox-sensing transcriptional regulator
MALEWMDRANCRGVGPELFFPDPGGDGPGSYRFAAGICARCPVIFECRNFALKMESGEKSRHGMWGGLNPAQREDLAAVRRRTTG